MRYLGISLREAFFFDARIALNDAEADGYHSVSNGSEIDTITAKLISQGASRSPFWKRPRQFKVCGTVTIQDKKHGGYGGKTAYLQLRSFCLLMG